MNNNENKDRKPIRVGLIGAGAWALNGHVRVLKLLPDYELTAVYARRRAVAEQAAQNHGFKYLVATPEELVNHPDVDLVVVATPTPQHAESVRLALAAGKDVYCEWPLTTTSAIAAELLKLAQDNNARHLVGLQRRLAPHNRYVLELLEKGFVGAIRSVRIHVSIPYLGERRWQSLSWSLPIENFANVVTIYAGHFLDMLFAATGWPTDVSAIQMNQFPEVTIEETGAKVPNTSLEQLVAIGRIGSIGAYSAHVEGGKYHGTGVQIEITGTEGDLRITNGNAFGDQDYLIEGAKAGDAVLQVMSVPEHFNWMPPSHLPPSVVELGQLYAAFARDLRDGTHVAPTFADALRMHQLFDAFSASSASGERVPL
ncbi:Gfo/Idh/MocA family protein [Massilia niastensis]|uniref:Gfo/Idh/MocA family protein n=1 Tax=Massilia niastensis TaxID=544911 RepID=UPI000476AEA2|nr:Gfo/Idh/MocA family oxidoreductase [Massilia niastensis]